MASSVLAAPFGPPGKAVRVGVPAVFVCRANLLSWAAAGDAGDMGATTATGVPTTSASGACRSGCGVPVTGLFESARTSNTMGERRR